MSVRFIPVISRRGRSGVWVAGSTGGKYLGDPTITAAVLDRLALTSVRLDIDGPSYRQHLANAMEGCSR